MTQDEFIDFRMVKREIARLYGPSHPLRRMVELQPDRFPRFEALIRFEMLIRLTGLIGRNTDLKCD